MKLIGAPWITLYRKTFLKIILLKKFRSQSVHRKVINMRNEEFESYEAYQKRCEQLICQNNEYLNEFSDYLEKSGISVKTANKHLDNSEFYINTFLIRFGGADIREGCSMLDDFFADFFIHKCMWSTPSSIKSTSTSLKKFYKCMMDHGHIEKDDYEEVCATIKEGLDYWIDICENYNDPDLPNPFTFF